jgi:hypothetical protein
VATVHAVAPIRNTDTSSSIGFGAVAGRVKLDKIMVNYKDPVVAAAATLLVVDFGLIDVDTTCQKLLNPLFGSGPIFFAELLNPFVLQEHVRRRV